MSIVKKQSGSFLLGLTVFGLAISTSAFTEITKENNKLVGEIYVNTTTLGDYEKLPTPASYLDDLCEENSGHICSWIRTTTSGTVPDEFTSVQADSLENEGLIAPHSELEGIYPL